MAVSGVFTFDPSRDQLIEAALRRIGVLGVGQSASANQLSAGDYELNELAKEIQNKGTLLWTRTLAQQALTASSHVVNGGVYYKARKGHTSASTDEPGTGNNWETYWYVVSDVSATAWALSTAYTAIQEFSLPSGSIGVEKVFYKDTNGDDFDIELIEYNDYLDLIDKEQTGRPTLVAFKYGNNTRKGYLYPAPDSADYIINYTWVRRIYDYSTGANTSDFEQNWIPALRSGLAHKLSFIYGIDPAMINMLFADYQRNLKEAMMQNSEVVTCDRVSAGW
jgi:hypothetical protein